MNIDFLFVHAIASQALLDTSDADRRLRALQLLTSLITALSTKRLPMIRRAFRGLCESIVTTLYPLWKETLSTIANELTRL